MPAEIEVSRLLVSLADPAVTLQAPSAVVVRQASRSGRPASFRRVRDLVPPDSPSSPHPRVCFVPENERPRLLRVAVPFSTRKPPVVVF